MVACDVDFTGDSYEVTRFEDSDVGLKNNIVNTDKFLNHLGTPCKSDAIESAYVWRDIDSEIVLKDFIDQYKIFNCSLLHAQIPLFEKWMMQMNKEKKFLKWNVAIAGDNKSSERWEIANVDVGMIVRSRKKKPDYIDIGSLRSGRDILCDICTDELTAEQWKEFDKRKRAGKNLMGLRYEMGLGDVPLLLLYRMDHTKGNETKFRTKLGSKHDIIGFSIIVSGQETTKDYVKTVQIKQPE
jgi:hypothetical protein